MQMGTSMRASGRMTRHTAMEAISMLMVLHILEIGRMISNTVKESRHGQMEQNMKETISKVKSTEREL